MKRCSEGQTDQGEVLDDCSHVTSALRTFRSKSHVIIQCQYKQERFGNRNETTKR